LPICNGIDIAITGSVSEMEGYIDNEKESGDGGKLEMVLRAGF